MAKYLSKLLLFGEHIVVTGARALATPYPAFSGCWAFAGAQAGHRTPLGGLLDYLRQSGPFGAEFDLEAFATDLSRGLYFESDIPVGYGLGSSGALCAAVYDRYALRKIGKDEEDRLPDLQLMLGRMESFFHDASSGVDPLVCYLARPLLIQAGKVSLEDTWTYSFEHSPLFLLDTQKARKTGPLVALFLEKYQRSSFRKAVERELFPANEAAIQALLQGERRRLWDAFRTISEFEWRYLSEMIPSNCRDIWKAGLDRGEHLVKLCGAGGGGFMLGLAKNKDLPGLERWPGVRPLLL